MSDSKPRFRALLMAGAAVSALAIAGGALAQSSSPTATSTGLGSMTATATMASMTVTGTPSPAMPSETEAPNTPAGTMTATMTVTAMPSMAATVPPVASAPPQPTDRLITAGLTGAQEVPPTDATEVGSFRATLEDGQLCYSLGVDGKGFTMAHIHHGAAGTNGDPVVDLFMNMAGTDNLVQSGCIRPENLQGSLAGNWDGFVAALDAGDLYVNVHSLAHPDGEVRGQILVGSVPTVTVSVTPVAPIVGSGRELLQRSSDAWFFGGSIVAIIAVALAGGWIAFGGRR